MSKRSYMLVFLYTTYLRTHLSRPLEGETRHRARVLPYRCSTANRTPLASATLGVVLVGLVVESLTILDGELRPGDPIEKFVMLLEERMARGYRDTQNRVWAATFGIEHEQYDRIRAEILRTWRLETKTVASSSAMRDELRVRLLMVYNLALDKCHFGAAVRALETIAKLDGLLEDSTVIDVTVTAGQITNRSRERVMDLMKKAKELAAARRQAIDVPSGGGSGSNGHGTNGRSE